MNIDKSKSRKCLVWVMQRLSSVVELAKRVMNGGLIAANESRGRDGIGMRTRSLKCMNHDMERVAIEAHGDINTRSILSAVTAGDDMDLAARSEHRPNKRDARCLS